jgi:predicted Zn-dependent protease
MQRGVLVVEKRVLRAEHPSTLTSMCNIASSLSGQGKYTQAEEMESEVLVVEKRVLRAEHPDTLATASNLASTLCSQGKHAEAEEMQREVLALQNRPADGSGVCADVCKQRK